MRFFSWFGAMAAQVFMILLVGIIAAAAFAFTVSDAQRRDGERRERDQRTVDRLVDLARYLEDSRGFPPCDLFGPGPESPRLAVPGAIVGSPDPVLTHRVSQRLDRSIGVVATMASVAACADAPKRPPSPRLGAPPPPGPVCRQVQLSLSGGRRVALILPTGPPPPREPRGLLTPILFSILAIAAATMAYGVAGLATAPLRRLSKAAVDLGEDLDGPALAVEGSREVRQAARAFNAMQVRLKQEMTERTFMLAAITHDLRTPMTRQRLRLENVADPALREQLLADQAEMLEMIADGLNLARASSDTEAWRDLDVDSLLQSLCEDATNAGAEVEVTARCETVLRTRPQALKRCVANLMDNALKYAGSAELSAAVLGAMIEIKVSDRGPGVAGEDLDRITIPFFRLETSRSKDTAGVGLGLTIARLLAERCGASLSLRNRPGGGLEASVLIYRRHEEWRE